MPADRSSAVAMDACSIAGSVRLSFAYSPALFRRNGRCRVPEPQRSGCPVAIAHVEVPRLFPGRLTRRRTLFAHEPAQGKISGPHSRFHSRQVAGLEPRPAIEFILERFGFSDPLCVLSRARSAPAAMRDEGFASAKRPIALPRETPTGPVSRHSTQTGRLPRQQRAARQRRNAGVYVKYAACP